MSAMPPSGKSLSRHSFVDLLVKACLAGSAVLGLGALGRYISFQEADSRPTQFDLGLTSSFPPGSSTPVPQVPAFIIHDEQGFKALSLVCPHLGCTVNPEAGGFACPCHGSRFYADGSLRNGPASHPLPGLRVEVNSDDHLVVYTG
jgi:cytochrome b6-f complex iron-sulfur subunit